MPARRAPAGELVDRPQARSLATRRRILEVAEQHRVPPRVRDVDHRGGRRRRRRQHRYRVLPLSGQAFAPARADRRVGGSRDPAQPPRAREDAFRPRGRRSPQGHRRVPRPAIERAAPQRRAAPGAARAGGARRGRPGAARPHRSARDRAGPRPDRPRAGARRAPAAASTPSPRPSWWRAPCARWRSVCSSTAQWSRGGPRSSASWWTSSTTTSSRDERRRDGRAGRRARPPAQLHGFLVHGLLGQTGFRLVNARPSSPLRERLAGAASGGTVIARGRASAVHLAAPRRVRRGAPPACEALGVLFGSAMRVQMLLLGWVALSCTTQSRSGWSGC